MPTAVSLAALLVLPSVIAPSAPYGADDAAGHYLQVDDVKLYYEVYGEGPPVLLLHGGLYGYIDEFASYIDALRGRHTVIAPAMRGHGRSALGTRPFELRQQAREAHAVLAAVSPEPAVVIGFSHGARVAYALAAQHPEAVRRLVAIGAAAEASDSSADWAKGLTAARFEEQSSDFVRGRRALMPDPERWDEFFERLLRFYASGEGLPESLLESIRVPTLLIGGDGDFFTPVASLAATRDRIPGSRLLILPGYDHVASLQGPLVLEHFVLPFVEE
jgi:pimeloyl-ACP methyl ester carboxylesterase